jgi:hypothetical protein
MGRRTAPSFHDRQAALQQARWAALDEVERLDREEAYLLQQVRRAEDQVRYYERLLAKHRRDWGPPARLSQLLRRLG